ncbi:bifunctional tetrahydrofolate synthase/dihydrofolate synthase [Canicola haemoglobinophilus]|uniref:Dihydrofolate synthase/folylpolyglutamate synthase n=1 Tax=Canicola haemoglobinophilus TaxID=733 RepID=A0A1V4AZL1_9PAST|nr:bifunctional tetrahydrofolate synthase/dihydrofolate synthase [Canicola haemoglobinophilus]OOR98651.1 bifunctional tetrahydrofolate synthase/dihydrofolate synthase [Canicola haemoglobinophilus]STO60633.1 folylpolyglutamate synthase [Canicola haemoglobinophilus]
MSNSNLLTSTSPLEQWLCFLENAHFKAIDLGLDRVKSVAQQLDLLRPAPFVITVGGTNGKGTTCRLLEMLLLNAGLRVGVYSSPHLIRYNERVRIQNQELADELHTEAFAFIEQHKSQSLTYFEFSTLSALYLFKQANLDVVILEVGLGGRLDATNIVNADLAVITSIDIDHTDFLGNTREEIAFEKAGIFRPNKPAIIGEANIPSTLLEHGKKLNALLSCRNTDWTFSIQENSWAWETTKVETISMDNLPICNIPLANAATALATLPYLPFDISLPVIHKSLREVELTGRFQKMKLDKLTNLAKLAEKPIEKLPQIILDVGHNPHAALYLAEKLTALKAKSTGKIIAVCGILKDKDSQGILTPLINVIDHWNLVTLEGARGQGSDALFVTLQQISQTSALKVQTYVSVYEGVKSAVQNFTENDVVLVFGSFYTVGAFLELL